MAPQVDDEGVGGEYTLAELIRMARTHQSIAQALLARAEKLGSAAPAESPVAAECFAGWNLTDREKHVAELLAEGLSNRRIARKLEISERTVKNHLHSIFYKLSVGDRTQAVIKLMRGAVR